LATEGQVSITAVCRQLGYSKQAYYKSKTNQQVKLCHRNTAKQKVLSICRQMPRLGTYTVVATIGSCTSVPASIIISDSASSKLWIYPSPNTGRFTVSYYSAGASSTNKTRQQLTIIGSDGRRVYNNVFDVTQPYQLHQIDLRRNGAGVYYVVLRDANGNKIRTGEVVVK
jgi:hypothetical protein